MESFRIKFIQENPNQYSLVIDDLLWRDSGIYTCFAYNDAGDNFTSCIITVEGKFILFN